MFPLHFSIQTYMLILMLNCTPSFGFENLKKEYEAIGTEGHDLEPYRHLQELCRSTTLSNHCGDKSDVGNDDYRPIYLHGGFIPRPMAARLNKCQNLDEERQLFEETFDKDILPGGGSSNRSKYPAMNHSLFDCSEKGAEYFLPSQTWSCCWMNQNRYNRNRHPYHWHYRTCNRPFHNS